MKGGDKPKVGIGCTAVYFRYYKSSKFSLLMGVQRKKLIEHLSGKGGGAPKSGGGGSKQSRSGGSAGRGDGSDNTGGTQAVQAKNERRQIEAAQVLAIKDQVVERLSSKEVTPGVHSGTDAKKYIMPLLGQDEGTTTSTAVKTRVVAVTASAKVATPAVAFIPEKSKVGAAPNMGV